MTGSAPGTGTSASGRQSTSMPSAPRSAAIRWPAEPGGREPDGRLAVVELAIARAGRIGRPMRRPEALHPAALLVDQNGRLPADGIAEMI